MKNLAFLNPDAPIKGELRSIPEDFRVDELPAYLPSGSGDHTYLRIEKRDLTTPEAVRRIARALATDVRNAGYAGLKDRHAVTTQWLSFLEVDPDAAARLELDGIRILEVSRHNNKLRTGHLRANRFRVAIRGIADSEASRLRTRAERVAVEGVPNYFGAQRFGREGANVERAMNWVARNELPPREAFERKLFMSVFQSLLFNEVVHARISMGALHRALAGDLFRKEDSGGIFFTEDLADAQQRIDEWSISPTGPMFGAEMKMPSGETLALESRVLEASGVHEARLRQLAAFGAGTRRAVRLRPVDLQIEFAEGTAILNFTLVKGAYATTLLREIFAMDLQTAEAP